MEPAPESRVIDERATRTWLGADGIVRSQVRHGCNFTEADSAAALAATRSLAPSLPAPVLVDCRGVRSATREARLFWQKNEARGALSAMGVLVGSPVSRMIATFFLRLVDPDFKVRIFSSESDAIAWLSEVGR